MTPSRILLHDFAKGHPQAMVGLREYQSVAEAAVELFGERTTFSDLVAKMDKLREALKAGGWID